MLEIFTKSLKAAHEDKISHLAASITFYALFALAPVIIIFISVAGAIFGEQAAKGELVNQIQSIVGPEMASAMQGLVENAALSQSNIFFTLVSLLILLFAASRVVTQLKYALNHIWKAESSSHKKIHKAVKSKFLSMLAILGIGLFLVMTLITSGILSTVWVYIANFLPINPSIFQILNLIISFGLMSFIIALIYKTLPTIDLKWKDVWAGALMTTALLMVGNWLIGLYMRHVSVGSVYGAAGSLIIVLSWLYYISQIFLLGAEYAKVYSQNKGSHRTFFKKVLDKF